MTSNSTIRPFDSDLFSLPEALDAEIRAWLEANPSADLTPHRAHPLIPNEFVLSKREMELDSHPGVRVPVHDITFTWEGTTVPSFIGSDTQLGGFYCRKPTGRVIYRELSADDILELYHLGKTQDGRPRTEEILRNLPFWVCDTKEFNEKFLTVIVDKSIAEPQKSSVVYVRSTNSPTYIIAESPLGYLGYEDRRTNVRTVHGITWYIGLKENSSLGSWGVAQAETDGFVENLNAKTTRLYGSYRNKDGLLEGHKASVPDIIEECFKHEDKESDIVYLGLELEGVVKDSKDFSTFVREFGTHEELSKYGILKHDGSTGPNGLEITTIPATLRWHKKSLESFFKDFSKHMLTNSRHGIHVHIGKKHITQLEQVKIMQFMNSPANRLFVKDIAGRATNKYCKFFDRAKYSTAVLKRVHYENRDDARRWTVNLTNPHTIELRIFQGSVKRNTVFRKLEFTDSLVRFIKQYPVSQMTQDKYIEFMLKKENQSQYPFMIRWLGSKNYVKHERKFIPKLGKLIHIFGENKTRKVTK